VGETSDASAHVRQADIPPSGSANDYGGEVASDYRHRSASAKLRRPLKIHSLAEIVLMPMLEWLMKGVITAGGLSIWYGQPGVGKSVLLTYIAAKLAQGAPVFGRKVQQCCVVYVACEGVRGFRLRIEAMQLNGVLNDMTAPFGLVDEALDLVDPEADTDRLLQALSRFPKVDLVIIDTVARSLGGSEESDAGFGAFLRTCNRIIMQIGAHVALIHHSGKDATRGPRGHSSMLAAVDTAVEIRRDSSGSRTATIVKQRDGLEGVHLTFDVQSVFLRTDGDGEPVTSCIVVEVVGDDPKARQKLTGQPLIAYKLLEKLLADGAGFEAPPTAGLPARTQVLPMFRWRENAFRAGLSKSANAGTMRTAINRSKKELVNSGLIRCLEVDGVEVVWMTGQD